MPTFRAPRGTRDLLPAERSAMLRLEAVAAALASRYGYRPIETPLFEQTAVFERGIGDATDIVEKELFRLAPRTDEGEAWALRPEPTAGIVRAYVQHGMQTLPQPVKLALIGPMFRYDRAHADRLPPLERQRLERNPLRLLDSKEPAMVELNASAPVITEHLCDACAAHFEGLRAHLDALGIRYRLDPRLVRGLDYYTRTAFEVYPRDAAGQQSAIGGGGRYDGLVELLGGRPTPGIGFGLGLDRIVRVLEAQGAPTAPDPAAPVA